MLFSYLLKRIFFLFAWQQKLERLQEEELVEKPFERKQMKIKFPERGKSGRSVVTIKNLEFGFEDKVRYQDLIIENLSIEMWTIFML